jgi:serine/threonine protein kinase
MQLKPIGKGSFGIVWKSRILSGQRKDELVAIKIINLDDFRDKSIDEIRVRGEVMNRKR